MNHASISPDGKLLLAVGDRHTAFFRKRVRVPSASSDGGPPYARYEWHEIADIDLSFVKSREDCIFSTAFSPSGRMYISKNTPNFLAQDSLRRLLSQGRRSAPKVLEAKVQLRESHRKKIKF